MRVKVVVILLFISNFLYSVSGYSQEFYSNKDRAGDYSLSNKALLTVEDAIKTALAQNPDIGMARASVNIAEEALQKTDALFKPRVTIFSEVSTGDPPSD